ncbi:DUF2065 domain-containing protein [Marivivens marinus]|uniref:DUF2065 domain-containing protein n=1 Tax=Marivivens marinus TaxID=3110173 RepID=UPI003B848524
MAEALATALLALGLVFVVEGLIYAIAPSIIEDLLDAMRRMPLDQRRAFGLGALALGVVLVWIAKGLGA